MKKSIIYIIILLVIDLKNNLRKNKTNELLSKALIELLKEKSFEDIKLNEICDKALVHKTTFYNHFQDKYELLYYVVKNIQKNMEMNIDDSKGIIIYYLEIAKEYIKNIKENAEFYNCVLKSNQNGICLDIFYNLFVDNVKQKIHNYKNNIPIPSNYIAKFYVSAVFSLITEWVVNGMQESEEEIIKYLEILIKNEKNELNL